jgi:hypothetical protein
VYEDGSLLGYSCVFSLKYTDILKVRTASIVALMMEAESASETPVYFNGTTRRYIPDSSRLYVISVVFFRLCDM